MNAPVAQHLCGARILVRSVNWLGDAVMSTPALLRLREAKPDAFIALLSPEKLAELWDHHPAINQVLAFRPEESAFGIARRLRNEGFGIGLVLPNSFRSGLELWLAGVPRRVGYGGQWRTWLLTDAVAPRPGYVPMRKRSRGEIVRLTGNFKSQISRFEIEKETGQRGEARSPSLSAHHIHQYLHLVSRLGASPAPLSPQLCVTEDEVRACLGRFQIESTPARPLFGLNPGAEYGPAKRWPAENFVSAAREIQRQTRCRWLIFGGRGDTALAHEIAAGIANGADASQAPEAKGDSVVNLAGATSLRELCAALKACRVLLSNDTGPMHIAAAVGTPVIVPFGSTSPELTGPGLPGDSRHRFLRAGVSCAPCFLRECPIDFRCMRAIPVAAVIQAVVDASHCASLSR